jgi:hypothetical protein
MKRRVGEREGQRQTWKVCCATASKRAPDRGRLLDFASTHGALIE